MEPFLLDQDEVRKRFPNLAQRSDRGSLSASVRLFCLECVGGHELSVRQCDQYKCPLHPHRVGKRRK